ncbi:hypothetical protein PT974_03860 [Cladobotryum mycophilum]|uniref:N-acetyltransferase ESCO zinc-finger domain-containing protein n=1 Tax=Cladobotryum mycophilum TaxID=491253 RepID=A0ABR0STH6_9HYPO
MVNSSPEYSITKPGLYQRLRTREKTLRTYGRRTATPEIISEPPSKKQRFSEKGSERDSGAQETSSSNHDSDTSKSTPIEQEPEAKPDSPATVNQEEANTKKGSILSYFKPAASKPQLSSPPQPADALPEEPISPILSAGEIRKKRKPRLLKIRAVGVLSDATDASDEEAHDDEKSEDNSEDAGSGGRSISQASSVTGDDRDLRRGTLMRGQEAKRKGLPKAKASPTVQTTLNISAQAAFSECKICDTVWNPLYPDDVKYHTKRHKAVLRVQNKKLDDL